MLSKDFTKTVEMNIIQHDALPNSTVTFKASSSSSPSSTVRKALANKTARRAHKITSSI